LARGAEAASSGDETKVTGITLDTGALIAMERRHARALTVLRGARADALRITIPAAVVAEWWRGRFDVREMILAASHVEPMDESLARAAGEALAAVRGATTVDAIVMASAARRGDVVYTGDIEDLTRLQRRFPSVRVLSM
jgi:predicted nucleic acid-binding protein